MKRGGGGELGSPCGGGKVRGMACGGVGWGG